MKNYFVILVYLLIPFLLNAQQKSNYLEGAVPEVDGKVVFTETVLVKNKISQDKLFELMTEWVREKFKPNGDLNSRVLLVDPETKSIACALEQYLVFKKGAFSIDRAKMSSQFILEIEGNKCNLTIRNIKYDYPDSKETVPAEEKINDKYALSKDKDKLNRYYDKFRIHTIDSINSLFNSIDVYLNGVNTSIAGAVLQPTVRPENNVVNQAEAIATTVESESGSTVPFAVLTGAEDSTMPGFKSISADKIPGNIIKLLGDAMLITSGSGDNVNVMAASWGGIGRLWEMPVGFCFLNPTRYSVQTMDGGDTYTLSFYTETYKDAVLYCGSVSGRNTDKIKGSGLTPIKTPSGASAFSEAWLILECKKLLSQELSPNAAVVQNLPVDWTKNGYHKMYIGEIVNVWVK